MKLPYEVPEGLLSQAWLGEGWADFLRRLPKLADEITDEWGLTYDGEPRYGYTALVAPVRTDDGRRAVLKLGILDEDGAGEPVALQLWGGRGAVELWRADPRRGAMVLERLQDDSLATIDDLAACEVVGGLYSTLHRTPSPRLPELRPLLARWLDQVRAMPRDAVPSRFAEQALSASERLLRDAPSAVLHGDLHYDNVLAGDRAPWIVIDPKGYAGDPAYELAPMLWNRWAELGEEPGTRIRDRFWALVDASGLDELRCRDWVVVRAVVCVAWEHVTAAGRELTAAQREWVTRCITVAKAMQAI